MNLNQILQFFLLWLIFLLWLTFLLWLIFLFVLASNTKALYLFTEQERTIKFTMLKEVVNFYLQGISHSEHLNPGEDLVSVVPIIHLRSCKIVDTIHIQVNMNRNTNKGIDDFYLISSYGQTTMTGSLNMEEALEVYKKKILLKLAMVKLSWLPVSALPSSPKKS